MRSRCVFSVPLLLSLLLGIAWPVLAYASAQTSATGPTTTILSPLASSPPQIDGVVGVGEWNLSSKVEFANGFLVAANDGIRLYILLDVLGDTADGAGDYFWITFDVDEDGVIDANQDLNYGIHPTTGNMRYQYYLGPSQWTGLQPSTRSSRAKGFDCFFGDGTLQFTFSPFSVSCASHRVWEFGFDLAEIGAQPGDTIRMGFRAASGTPSFTNDVPANFSSNFSNLIQVNLSNVTLPSPSPSATIVFDANPIEFTQAIQTRGNTLPLVQDKATVARMYVDVNGVAASQPVIAYLYGSVGGVDLPGSPLATLYQAPTSIDRAQLSHTANFALPSSWDQGTVTFKGKARTLLGGEINTADIGITFNARKRPTYWYIPINTGTNASPTLISTSEMDSQRSYLETVYPVPGVNWVFKPWTVIGPTTIGNAIAELNEYYNAVVLAWALSVLFTGREPYPLPDQIYGFTPSGGGLSDPVWVGAAGRVARGFRGTSLEGTMAHEINHNLDRSATGTWGRHVPGGCGAGGPDSAWPYSNDDIQEVGFDTRQPWVSTSAQKSVVPSNVPDFMSYCQSGFLPTKWISPYRWTNLYGTFAASASAAMLESVNQVQVVYYISGEIHRDSTGSLNPAFVQPGIPSMRYGEGNGELRILDAGGKLLDSFPFPVEFLDDPEEPVETVYFNFLLPYRRGAKKIVLFYQGRELDNISFSPNPPTVMVTSPQGGQSFSVSKATRMEEVYQPMETLRIAWSASDLDGDALYFTLLYSPDDGQNWYPIVSNIQGNSYDLDLNLIPGGAAARIRVIVSDGVNTAQDDSDGTFIVGDHAPVVTASAPPLIAPGAPVPLIGEAVDQEDGLLPDDRLVWTEGTNGLGTGRRLLVTLDPGPHTITLSATDQDGNTTQATLSVFVGHRLYLPLIKR
ncbi:MAG: hypothetical protein RML36_07710 [Anaerolineae bacterium]|nr:hypothetical protein [Anaerolineae bacterium]MDW8099352.1 hypothetical protein [Anaerolineae bacterium]